MPDTPDVRLNVGGVRYGGWTGMRIEQGLGQVAGRFTLELTDKHPGAPGKFAFRMGSTCTVSLDGQTVITGYVEAIQPRYAATDHGITIAGRDKTGDLADCSHLGPPDQWRGQTLARIAADVCRPFGITVNAEAERGEAFPDVRPNEGDSVLAFLVRLARQRRATLVSFGDGRLTITTPGSRRAPASLKLGENVIAGSAEYSDGGRFSRYIVKGQGASRFGMALLEGAEDRDAVLNEVQASYVNPKGEATDGAVTRYRPLVIVAGNQGVAADFAARAAWEAVSRAGKSRRLKYTVQGWGENGALWRPGALVDVTDAWLGSDGQWLIESVNFSLDEGGGSRTELALVHPDSYRPEPFVETSRQIIGGYDNAD